MLSSGSPVGLLSGRVNNLNKNNSSIVCTNNSNMQQSNSFMAYGERPQLGLDVEYGTDPASGAIFKFEGRKHDDLKQMLDSNKDSLKLEAMKRIIGMIARGRDASDLFPAVVKNVVSKNIEVKKLVYVYLVRYAEEQQDLALLSISTFQRALKDPNQLIRASALRVLSSIRVSMIVPIVMLAIKDSASDMSPYVRKTAAHAIPKLYSLDAEQKDELVTVIEKLLSDRTTLVVGSAVMAFEEVCPERVDLIHRNYRKLCNLLVDVDEWGQVIIINMLTRYARTQFVNPNLDDVSEDDCEITANQHNNTQKFYDDFDATADNDIQGDSSKSDLNNSTSSGDSNKPGINEKIKKSKRKQKKKKKKMLAQSPGTPISSSCNSYHVDLDHRLLLRQTKPLLQSRNASVVMAVAQLYHHVAPRQEVQIIGKALIRLLRSHKEVQSVVLTCIASMSTKRKVIFETYIKSFFVRTNDPTHIKLLKLEVLTNLASASTISLILREFQTYIMNTDRSFVAATIQAIGRCAASIKEVTETCLNGLVHLLSHRDEYIVAESVVVIKKLLQTKAAEHYEIIIQMAKLLDYVKVAAARAAITWLIGEYNEKVNKIAPDVLRKLAKSFVDEEDIVKLQILNLAVKLYLTNPEQTSLLCQYVFSLARYDINYDIRDRARFLKQFIFPVNNKTSILYDMAKEVFLADKPAPTLESHYYNRNNYQLGSLSHYLNVRCHGYNDLPDFPIEPSDPTVRNVEEFTEEQFKSKIASSLSTSNIIENPHKTQMQKALNRTNDSVVEGEEKKNNLTESDTSSSSDSESTSDSSNSSSNDDINDDASNSKLSLHAKKNTKLTNTKVSNNSLGNNVPVTTSDSDESSYYTSETTSSNSSTSPPTSDNENEEDNKLNVQKKEEHNKLDKTKNDLDLLLDLDDVPPMGPVMTPSLAGFLSPGMPLMPQMQQQQLFQSSIDNAILTHDLVGPSYINYQYKELINKVQGHGLQISYRYTRSPHLYSSDMVSIELQFINHSNCTIRNIRMGEKSLASGMEIHEFPVIYQLNSGQCLTSIIGVNFNDSTHAIQFEILTNENDNRGNNNSSTSRRIHFKPCVGELIRAIKISEMTFKEERTKLRGMNEHQSEILIKPINKYKNFDNALLKQKFFEIINVSCIGTSMHNTSETDKIDNELLFVGQTMSSKSWILITCSWHKKNDTRNTEEDNDSVALVVQVNCEKMVIGSMVLNELTSSLKMSFQ